MIRENIILIGFMGSGKSSLGKKLARKLGYEFLDTDTRIEEREGMSVAEIFQEKGEEYFRRCERELLDRLEAGKGLLIACGGGFPCQEGMMEGLKQLGLTVYLSLSAKELSKRLKESKQARPLIVNMQGEVLEEYISHKLEDRRKYYEQADLSLFGRDQRIKEASRIIRSHLLEN
ncbi:MAG: shikimate kinase [Bacteroidetes bacterium]|nr:MAG: shikimate kinase [Bacteroidota bacterium]